MVRRFLNLRDIFRILPADGRVRDELRKFNLAPVVDRKARSVRNLAERLGFSVARVSDLGKASGRLVRDPFSKNGFRIEVNANHSIQAQRWAVLHEIGHYFLHVDRDDPFAADMAFDASGDTFYIDVDEEKEANAFAEALLFGDGALKAALSLHNGDIDRVARQFGVSRRVVEIAKRRFG